MCGRYILRQLALAEKSWAIHGPPTWHTDRYNVAPTQQVPVVIQGESGPLGLDMRWGLIPFCEKGVAG
ncbi:MAG: SOS response-associated peptidase family protein [bacterium]